MELLKILLLSVVQGITEFLPISSSGHLAIISKVMEIKEDTVLVVVVLHAGSLVSIISVYYREIMSLFSKEKSRVIFFIIIATIPVGIIGMLLHFFHISERLFTNLIIPGCGLILTGIILLLGMKEKKQPVKLKDMTFLDALLIGIIQCIAVLPGVSRSGSTIAAGMQRKLQRTDAATFSFLIALPAIAGASLVEIGSFFLHHANAENHLPSVSVFYLIVGFIVSAVVGYIALRILISQLKRGQFTGYGYYCICLGATIIIWQIIGLFK